MPTQDQTAPQPGQKTGGSQQQQQQQAGGSPRAPGAQDGSPCPFGDWASI